jgi:hypothetical protein
VGVGNAEELRYPLDPTKQLVLSKKQRPSSVRITTDRVVGCNQDLLAGCHRFVCRRSLARASDDAHELKPHRPVLRFNEGPLYERQPGGGKAHKGEMLHAWVPRR